MEPCGAPLVEHIAAKVASCIVFNRVITFLAEKAGATIEVIGDTSHSSSSGPSIEQSTNVDALQGGFGLVFQ